MGIMDRLSRLLRANINDALDRAEDPEKMLDQILRDMQGNIQTAREQVANMIAQEKELEADLREAEKLAGEWQEKARRAVAAGKDDLAREALRRKHDNDENANVYGQQFQVQTQTVEKLKTQLRQLEAKYSSTLSHRDSLIARQRRARAAQKVTETMSTFSPMDPTQDLERMERRIRSNEAKALAMSEMADDSFDAQFRELDYDDDVERELEALKAGGGLNPAIEAELSSLRDEGAEPAELAAANDKPSAP
jgi:phage shock protein A